MENQSSLSSSSPYPYPEYVMRMIGNQSISKKARIDYESRRDLLSELPLSIIHVILALVPFRDAVGTSLLSRQWRYTWTSLPYLIFEDKGDSRDRDEMYRFEERVQTIITHALFRHNGPIQKFKLSVPFRLSRPNIDAWVHYLSRNGIGELSLKMAIDNMIKMHSSIYSCNKLTYLELVNCMVDPPPSNFKGFLFLKCLMLIRVGLSPDEIESLVARCPILERFGLAEYKTPELRISAPNLKYLDLTGDYIEMCVDAPLLVEMSVELHVDDFPTKHLHQNALVCNYANFFGGFPNLKRLNGDLFFAKFLSTGIESCHRTLAFDHLKDIQLDEVNFQDREEILVIARLITDAPNLHNLNISTDLGGIDEDDVESFASDLESLDEHVGDFGCAPDCTFKKMRFVRMKDVIGFHFVVDFMEFLLERSPVLEKMTVVPVRSLDSEKKKRLSDELRRCSWASPNAQLLVPLG